MWFDSSKYNKYNISKCITSIITYTYKTAELYEGNLQNSFVRNIN